MDSVIREIAVPAELGFGGKGLAFTTVPAAKTQSRRAFLTRGFATPLATEITPRWGWYPIT